MPNSLTPKDAYKLTKVKGEYFVFWMLGNRCTYSCSYCPKNFHDGSYEYHSFDTVLKTLNKLPGCSVLFSGGEPTYHPQFEEILALKPDYIRISVISNASRPTSFWERVVGKLSSIILTYHIEFANLERFITTARVCQEKLKRINLTMVPTRFDECVAVYQRLKAEGLPVVPKALVKDFGAIATEIETYSNEQSQWFSDHREDEEYVVVSFLDRSEKQVLQTTPTQLLASKSTDFRGWICDVPLETLYIDYTGKVYDSACKQRRLLGTLEDDFLLPTKPVECFTSFCWCYSDIIASKRKGRSFDNVSVAEFFAYGNVFETVVKLEASSRTENQREIIYREESYPGRVTQSIVCNSLRPMRLVEPVLEHLTSGRPYKLGRVSVLRLSASEILQVEAKKGYYFNYYERVCIPISSDQGDKTLITVDEDTKEADAGKVYSINPCKPMSFVNPSSHDRYYLLIDIRYE